MQAASEAGVTAVVVTHNSARHLEPLGRALSSGSLAPTRMLAVDNLSRDGTVEQARAAGFEVIETGANNGFGAGCNVGLQAARTEFVLFCNPDVRPSREALARLLAALAGATNAAIAAASLDGNQRPRRFSRISTNVAGFLPSDLLVRLRRLQPAGAGFDRRTADARADRHAAGVRSDPDTGHIVVNYAEGAFLLCRVAPLRSLDGFDQHFFLYFEEEDLSRRLCERGWQTLLVPSAAVTHEQRGSSEDFGQPDMAPFFTHSLYWYYRKHSPRWYAELARCVIATCVTLDRGYRAISRQAQLYGRGAALAPFRDLASVRRAGARGAGTSD